MHQEFDELASLIGHTLADRWLRQQATRRTQPRGVCDGGTAGCHNSHVSDNPTLAVCNRPLQADVNDDGTNLSHSDDD